ncbi:glycosyltransferase 61 family protein [Microbacterium nymphoidis]|uniref:glycosyltransferase 61 family protein n=1 Tax=Microbacterium nymphoidis TaxID=2898586 RepID=UPI001E54E977|nr:glycosyltransferase 61 family protein [Microbacterium nymphoidis]MCD2498725.1 glycosyltransferase 61 family protein [Microbacterium nymphoidis]
MNTTGQPLIFANDSEKWRAFVAQNRRIQHDLSVQIVDDGIILPLRAARDSRQSWEGGVTDATGGFVAGHTFHPARSHRRNVIRGYEPEQVRRVEGVALYAGGIRPDQFGHFLTESLARLWWAIGNNIESMKVAFNRTYPVGIDHPNFSLVERLGISREQIVIVDEPMQFDKVVVPDQSFYLGNGEYHDNLRFIYDSIRDSVSPGAVEKIYFTRRRLVNRTTETRELNEEMLEDFYQRRGYKVVSPETLPLAEQISLIAGAKEIASTAGTLSHLVVFAQDGVNQSVLLRHPRSLSVEGQWGLSQMRAANIRIVDALLSLLPGSHTVGVVYFSKSSHFVEYAKQVHDVHVSTDSLESSLAEYLRNWAELLASTPDRFLKRYPEWTLVDLVDSIHSTLCGEPISDEARERLVRRFVNHEPEIRRPSHTGEIHFNSNGGTPIPHQVIDRGGVALRPADPERPGFRFGGWYNSPRLREEFDFEAPVTRVKTVHARWVRKSART